MEINYSNGSISPDDVIKFLTLSGQSDPVFAEVIKSREVMKKAEELGISASDEDLQKFADVFREVRGLYTADETADYLKNSGLTEDEFERFCESAVLTNTLKDTFGTEEKVKEYFINNRTQFDTARISSIAVKEESLAKEIVMQVTEDSEDFHDLARQHSLDEMTKHAGGYAGEISRSVLPGNISAKVFNASEGELLGPFQGQNVFQLILVEEVKKAELNERIREYIREMLFNEWFSQIISGGITVKP